nr:S8 family serine peptidase [Erysipelotrichaceae bacterium]
MRKLFNIVLVALLLTTGSFTSVLAEPDGNDGTDTGNTTEYWVQDIDPKTLDIHYLGEGMTEEVVEDEEPIYSDNDVVRVSIKLERPATLDVYSAENVADNAEAMSYRQSLQNEQENITKDIESKINDDLDVQWNLTLAVNVISANVAYGDIEVIKDVSGVEDVFIETRYELLEDDVNTAITTEYMVGAAQAWASGYTGAGSRLAIIDTGTNQDHISFDPVAFEYSLTKDGDSLDDYDLLTKEEIAAVLDKLNDNNSAAKHNISSADYVYKNLKIPFAFNYIDGNNTTDHYSDTQGEHGSHVSGIAAANRYIRTDNGFVEAVTEKFAVGVAPDAQILTMKVFGAGGGAYDSDYFAAIEDAIILKADSINLSLGSANPGSSFSGAYQNIMDNLIGSGSVVVMSAGNAYHWPNSATNGTGDLYLEDISEATGGSPGSFFNSIGVASAENIGGIGTPLIYNGSGIFYNESESGAARMASIPGTYEFVYIDGIGNTAEYETVNSAVSLAGKIVIVNRGGLSFFEKGNNLIDFEPAALIVANNQKGTIGMLLDGYEGKFPMVSIVLKDANKIKATAESNTAGDYTYYTGSMEVTSEVISSLSDARSDAEISPFSSWGPTGSLIIKPEITAPGGNIWSVNGMTDTEYEIMGGTSMAAPHVTGMMAVLAQYVRENDLEAKTGLDERTLMHSLLMSTATPMIVEGLYLPVIEQGAGLGDVNAAINAKSYILMNEGSTIVPGSAKDGKVKAEFGQDAERTGRYAYSFTINNFSDEDIDYTFRTDVFTQDAYSYNGLNYLDTYTLDLSANVSYSYEVHDVDRDGDTDTDDVQALLDFITGNRSGEELDLDAGEMDDRNGITSYDAQLLLECIQRKGDDILRVAAGDSTDVSVIIQVTD